MLSTLEQTTGDAGRIRKETVRTKLVETLKKDNLSQSVSQRVLELYRSLGDREERLSFFLMLCGDLGNSHGDSPVSRPLYDHVMSSLASAEGGIGQLVDMRADLLECLKTSHPQHQPGLSSLESCLHQLLSVLCSKDLMDVSTVTWQSPSDIIEKIGTDESVHPMRHWKDIKTRLGPNMRCFVLTNRGIPREPLVVLYSALTHEPSSSVQDLLKDANTQERKNFKTAVFYSVWLRKRGLAGLDLPNSLIKSAVRKLQGEFPHMTVFYTLSPIPGFRKWLSRLLNIPSGGSVSNNPQTTLTERVLCNDDTTDRLRMAVKDLTTRSVDPQALQLLRSPLMTLCAHYLARERKGGYPLDPVAHFHLKNGASLWRVNWMGDRSVRGLQRSLGMMVNYCYNTRDIADNGRRFRVEQSIATSDHIDSLLHK